MTHPVMKSLLLSATAAACLAANAAGATTLRFNNFLPRTSFLFTELLEPWAARVAEATGGSVEVEFTTSSLGAPPAQLDLVSDGIADLAFGIAGYTPDRLTLTAIAELPGIGNSSAAISQALWDTYTEQFAAADEFRGVHLIGFVTSAPSHLYTINGPITGLSDIEGLKLRVSGPVAGQIAEHFGAVPVGAPGARAYELLSGGVVDGTFFSHDGITDANVEGLIHHVTLFPGGLFNTVFFIVMNQDAWEALTDEERAAIDSVSGAAMAAEMGRAYDAYADQALDIIRTAGAEVIEASPELTQALDEVRGTLRQRWLDTAAARGIDGPAVLEAFEARIAATEAAAN